MPDDPVDEVIRTHTDSLMRVDGVIGVGQGRCNGTDCIVVFAESMTTAVEELPETIEGYKVRTEVTGPITAPPNR